MKKLDFVELINLNKTYEEYNLYLNSKGFVIKSDEKVSKILFFNEYNEGDYAFVEIFNEDIKLTKEQPPIQLKELIESNLQRFTLKEKGFKPRTFKAYSQVELLVDNEKYAEFGVHKGDIGTIMEDVAVQDYILVDFGRLDENNNYHGDCISVKLKDVKILEENKD